MFERHVYDRGSDDHPQEDFGESARQAGLRVVPIVPPGGCRPAPSSEASGAPSRAGCLPELDSQG
jgi:hypothetical protein